MADNPKVDTPKVDAASRRVSPRWKLSDGPAALARRIHQEDGAAAVPFVLAITFFIPIVAIAVQWALLLSAYVTVGGAAEAAARSAIVALPEQKTDSIRKAALMVLAPLSPVGSGAVDPEGEAIFEAYAATGMSPVTTFAQRYTYAMQGTQVTWDGRDFSHLAGTTAWVQVNYSFQLTVPIAATFLAPRTSSVGGINGRFFNITRRVQLFTSPSREAGASDINGPAISQ